MAITTFTATSCTHLRPSCLSTVGIWERFRAAKIPTPWCGNGDPIKEWIHLYRHCPPQHIWQGIIGESVQRKIFCQCIENPIQDCSAYYNSLTCQTAFISLSSIQLLVIAVALILNTIVVFNFIKDRTLKKRIPMILLLNQAIVDIVNCLLFGLPNAVALLIQVMDQKSGWLDRSSISLILTASSSIFMFTIIATERWVSVWKPLWHKVSMRKKYVWRSIALVWSVAAVLTVVEMVYLFKDVKTLSVNYVYYWVLCGILGLLVLYISVLFILTFVKAFRSIKAPQTESEDGQGRVLAKKQLRLTGVFFGMFFAFFLGFIAIMVLNFTNQWFVSIYGQILVTLFMMTSVLNPALALCLKRELRPCMTIANRVDHKTKVISMRQTTSRSAVDISE